MGLMFGGGSLDLRSVSGGAGVPHIPLIRGTADMMIL